MIARLATADIASGAGVCVIDPHGDLYSAVLDRMPNSRHDDLVLVDLADMNQVPGLNFLQQGRRPNRIGSSQIANELLSIFSRMYDMERAGGPIFEQYMRAALLLLMDNQIQGLTLCEVPTLFENATFRQALIAACTNPQVVSFWGETAEKTSGEHSLRNMAGYITSKLNQFTHNAIVRGIVGQSESTLDFRRFMDEGKVVLVRLPKGLLGEKETQLLGMLIVGRLYLAALERAEIPPEQRRPFNVYIDECQNFVSDTVAAGLGEARKYGLRFVLAHQHLAQLDGRAGAGNVKSALLGNAGSLLMFRLGVEDAVRLEAYARPEFMSADLQFLPDFRAVARILRDGQPLRPFGLSIDPMPPIRGVRCPEAIQTLKLARDRYARSVDDVEFEIARRPGMVRLSVDKPTSSHRSTTPALVG